MSSTMFITNNDKNKSKGSIDIGSQVKSKQEIIASLNTEIESITAEINSLNTELKDMKIALKRLKKEITTQEADYSRVIELVVADLCTTPVALSAPPNSFQNNSQS